MIFQFAPKRTGRPRTPPADIERRRARYRQLRERLPMSNTELAQHLNRHRESIRLYPEKLTPTDETLDRMQELVVLIARENAKAASAEAVRTQQELAALELEFAGD